MEVVERVEALEGLELLEGVEDQEDEGIDNYYSDDSATPPKVHFRF